MKHAYIFPGQGSQFCGMGKIFYDTSIFAKKIIEQANDILGFRLSDIMFNGSEEDLKQTKVTQPAIFLHSIIAFKSIENAKPDMVAGHSLGEFSALVANATLSFEDALILVSKRASAMQNACENSKSTMAAILNLDDKLIEKICKSVQNETGQIVVPANYNCPGQIVISGSENAIEIACIKMKEAGAKRAVILPVHGAFHSPLMQPAEVELKNAIENTNFHHPICPVYQNINATALTNKDEIKLNLIQQLTAPVLWQQSILNMIKAGATLFTECGPGKILQGLVNKIDKSITVNGVS